MATICEVSSLPLSVCSFQDAHRTLDLDSYISELPTKSHGSKLLLRIRLFRGRTMQRFFYCCCCRCCDYCHNHVDSLLLLSVAEWQTNAQLDELRLIIGLILFPPLQLHFFSRLPVEYYQVKTRVGFFWTQSTRENSSREFSRTRGNAKTPPPRKTHRVAFSTTRGLE